MGVAPVGLEWGVRNSRRGQEGTHRKLRLRKCGVTPRSSRTLIRCACIGLRAVYFRASSRRLERGLRVRLWRARGGDGRRAMRHMSRLSSISSHADLLCGGRCGGRCRGLLPTLCGEAAGQLGRARESRETLTLADLSFFLSIACSYVSKSLACRMPRRGWVEVGGGGLR